MQLFSEKKWQSWTNVFHQWILSIHNWFKRQNKQTKKKNRIFQILKKGIEEQIWSKPDLNCEWDAENWSRRNRRIHQAKKHLEGINFPSYQTRKHPQCPRKQTPHEAKKGNEDLANILPHSHFLNLQPEKQKHSYIDGFKNPTSYFKLN